MSRLFVATSAVAAAGVAGAGGKSTASAIFACALASSQTVRFHTSFVPVRPGTQRACVHRRGRQRKSSLRCNTDEHEGRQNEEEKGADRASSSSANTSPVAAYNRGVKYLKGLDGFEPDDSRAAACFLQAAWQEHASAQYAIGVMFLNGRGVERDRPRAAKWFMRAAKQGHAKAQYNLGQMLKHGDGIQRDAESGRMWTMHAADKGVWKALRSGDLLAFGWGPWMDLDVQKISIEGLFKKAESGDENAAMRLAIMLYDGDGMKQDKAQAAYWFMQAAQSGVSEAQYRLAGMLSQGDGVEKDEEYAMTFLTQAAEQEHPEAMYNLGVKFWHGEQVEQNSEAAAAWFKKAAEAGLPEAQHSFGWMTLVGDGVQTNVAEGCAWLEKAALAGNENARLALQGIR